MPKKAFALIILLALLAGCAPASVQTAASTPLPPSIAWWNDAVFYEIFVRSFNDSNGDGIGDFNGITQKLDYLNDGDPNTTTDLGVTGIWLMPIFPSPSYHGYDVTDYYSVNPQYGTMDDFRNLLKEAHKRGIKVIIDLVINHTSDKHPWFKSAKEDHDSPYRDWYIWSQTDPKYRGPWNEKVWHPSLTGYYYGIFESFMPDLNYQNPAVTQEMEKVIRFWLTDVSVDGFRMDAIKHLIEEGVKQENTVSTHTWLKENFYPTYKAASSKAMGVGELFGDDINTAADYIKGKQFDLAFNFQLANSFIAAANSGGSSLLKATLGKSEKVLPDHQYATFLTNHDQNRIMTQLLGDVNKAKVAASLLLTSPGVPFIYYGEEIGMIGQKPDENIRRPMQWSGEDNAGFTTGRPWRGPDTSFPQVNVAAQTNDPTSLFSHYRILIMLRNQSTALRIGNFNALDTDNSSVFASLRASQGNKVLVIINLSNTTISDYSLSIKSTTLPAGEYKPTAIMGSGTLASLSANQDGGFSAYRPLAELPPYATIILQLQ